MSSILVNQLIVVGKRKNYIIDFNPGVNIIYGDSATGKSGILNLIDYLLGSKKFDSYPEIEATARYAVLDVTLNETRYSIKRDIFDASKLIEVYQCRFKDIDRFPYKKYIPTFSNTNLIEQYEFFPEFVLKALNLTNLKLKLSPSKDNSKHSRLSFRDILKYCYVDQDDLGSKKFLDRGNYVLETRNAEVFKYIFNALDSQISELEQEISGKTDTKNKLEKKFSNVLEFLKESGFESMESLDDELSYLNQNIEKVSVQLKDINQRITADDDVYSAIRKTLDGIEQDINETKNKLFEFESKIENFSRLKNDYINDVEKFKASQESRTIIGELSENISLCPVCDNVLDEEVAKDKFEIPDSDKLTYEINSLKQRAREVELLIQRNRVSWDLYKARYENLLSERSNVRKELDRHMKEMISPYLSERDTFVSHLGALEQSKKEIFSKTKIRNQHVLIEKNQKALETDLINLRSRLNKLKENAPSLDLILKSISLKLKDYLTYLNIKDVSDISLTNSKFFPVIRGVEYTRITSGGLRTITSIGYLCSLLKESLDTPMSYPSFLMIDTVGKYLGKTDEKYLNETNNRDDVAEGTSDPLKYQKIFEYIIKLSEEYESRGQICQIILVDNDVPQHIINDLKGFVVAHYHSDGLYGLPVGFIDDV